MATQKILPPHAGKILAARTGLGLPITKEIVELHKGKIWIESEPGHGSKFIFVLPRDLRTRIIADKNPD